MSLPFSLVHCKLTEMLIVVRSVYVCCSYGKDLCTLKILEHTRVWQQLSHSNRPIAQEAGPLLLASVQTLLESGEPEGVEEERKCGRERA